MNQQKKVVAEFLFELEEYTKYHFNEEEKIFKTIPHNSNIEHINIHNEFIKTIRDLKFDYVSSNKEISLDLLIYIRDWLQNHVMVYDKEQLKH